MIKVFLRNLFANSIIRIKRYFYRTSKNMRFKMADRTRKYANPSWHLTLAKQSHRFQYTKYLLDNGTSGLSKTTSARYPSSFSH